MVLYYYGNCGSAELLFLFSRPICSGVSRSCVLFSIKACSRNDAREERRRTSFHLEHKGTALAAEHVSQGIVSFADDFRC